MWRLWLLVVLCLVPTGLLAHSGEKHPFPMVAFARPLPAPEFRLNGLGDRDVRLADYKGRLVLLNFWATWCPPCVHGMPSMERLHQQLAKRGLVVLALSQDDEGRGVVQPFVGKLKLTFQIALDTEQRVAGSFGVKDLPSTFLISPNGQVVAAVKGGLEWDSPAALEFIEHYLAGPPPLPKSVAGRP